jgi:integrase/recombinase XerD
VVGRFGFAPVNRTRITGDSGVTRLAVTAGIDKHLTPHSLRHSAITAALNAGVALRDVQEFARHADPRTTIRYDRARHSLDRHASCTVMQYVSGAS